MLYRLIVIKKARVLFTLFIGFLLVIAGLTFKPARAAENFIYNIGVNYSVGTDGITAVKETYNITNQTSNQYLDSVKVSTPNANISNISVYYTDGGSIPFETSKLTQESGGYKFDYTEIKINFNRANVGQGLRWGFIIQYNSPDIVENKGLANVVYIPGISSQNRDEYNVSLTVPSSFGSIHGFGKIPNLVSQNADYKTFAFSKDDLSNNSVQLLFGDSTTYKGKFVYPLKNDTNTTANYEITLPPSTASQATFVDKLDPAPLSTRVDKDGNVIARYQLEKGESLDVKADVLADVHYVQYDFANSGTLSDIPQNLKNEYTKSTKYWQADDSQIKQKAQELTANKKTVAEKIKAINDYVIQTLNYNNEKIKYNVRQGSVEALNNPNNVVCLEYSDLTIALLRAAGIPARMPVGYGYSGELKKSPAVSDSLHSWVQAYVPNNGWMNLDPTWGEKFNNFGISDIDHMVFAIWGQDDSSPFAIVRNGIDTSYQYEDVNLSYVNTIPVVANDAKISATNWVLLPFMSITTYQGSSASNATIFDAVIRALGTSKSKIIKTKSLAPSEKVGGLVINLGLSFVSYSKITLTDPTINRDLALSSMNNNYLPLIVLSVLVLSVILVISVIKLRNNRLNKKRQQHERTKE